MHLRILFIITFFAIPAAYSSGATGSGSLSQQLAAGLVYVGYLPAEKFEDPEARAFAFYDLLNEFRDGLAKPLDAVMRESFDTSDASVQPAAIDYLKEYLLLGFTPIHFREDLESRNRTRIAIAQSYLNLLGFENRADGVVDRHTFDTAMSFMSEEVTLPEHFLFAPWINTMIYRNALPVPADNELPDYLYPKEVEAARSTPLYVDRNGETWYREAAIVGMMIDEEDGTPRTYIKYLNYLRQQNMLLDFGIIE